MPETLRFAKGLMSWVWTQRTKILVLVLVMSSCRASACQGPILSMWPRS